MKSRNFILNMLILSLSIAGTTILYFAQMNLLYDYLDPETVYMATISYAYLAQGAGILLFMLLFRKIPGLLGRRIFPIGAIVAFIPILFASLLIKSGAALLLLLILTNLLIGFVLGTCFTNIAAFVSKEHVGMCWGAAYAIGNILSWLASQIDKTFMSSLKIIPIVCIVLGLAIVPIMMSKDLPCDPETEKKENSKIAVDKYLWISLVILLMTVIYTIGSTDYSMIAEKIVTRSTLYTRCIYAAGLFIAGLIYDKSHSIGSIFGLASIIYPIMASMLLKIEFQINLVYCLSYFFLGFLAVFRSAIFISLANEKRELLFLAGFGLLISRVAEGITALFNTMITRSELSGFIISGVLFIPLIIVFCMMILKQNQAPPSEEEMLSAFAENYNLTRREEEILSLLIHGATNGEISEALTISEGTARFHVSNLLKKTGCKTRNDIIHSFKQR